MLKLLQTRFFKFSLLFCLFCFSSSGQQLLKPGFDAAEYADLLRLKYDSLNTGQVITTSNHQYKLLFESPEVGLYNKCYFWLRNDDVVILCIRGTIGKTESWLENFYSAMIPAQGDLQLNDSTLFEYKFAERADAYVHVGWSIGMAFLAPYIVNELNVLYKSGKKEVIIFGHSQGGAIAYLVRSYLNYLPEDKLPGDIFYKTYCSAAPKPGNLYYTYDFDFINRGEWAFRTVNTADWVPETPLTVQTLKDMNKANPIVNYKDAIKEMPWLVRVYVNSVYKKIDKTANNGVKYYQKYLGNAVFDQIKKTLPQLREPSYAPSNHYMTAGVQIVLPTDNEYDNKFKFTGQNVFVHHYFEPYLFLLRKYYPKSN
ncbi:lipase family protein [Solitalea sp. MAHUQ-68]|uniref:Lipase family protein n=1 Tax=Solitalea agri TaxID=2953739 RepID=A0A9X2JB60_9SPHI|nr:lipase family protein [Solitalea agri]MCO4291698.1 lipase family protein [Solitalea agri]